MLPLTPAELTLLTYFAAGRPEDEIFIEMGLKPSNLRRLASLLYRKLDVHNRKEAVRAGRSLGLVPPAPPRRRRRAAGLTSVSGMDQPELLFNAEETALIQCLPGYPAREQIARQLGITQNRVSVLLTRIYKKLDVHTQLEAVRKVRELKLVPDRHEWK